MALISEIENYLDEKGIHYTIKGYPKRERHLFHLHDLSKKMFHEVILPALKEMAEVQTYWERYGKTTGERVIVSVKGVTDDRSYEIQYFGDASESSTITSSSIKIY